MYIFDVKLVDHKFSTFASVNQQNILIMFKYLIYLLSKNQAIMSHWKTSALSETAHGVALGLLLVVYNVLHRAHSFFQV